MTGNLVTAIRSRLRLDPFAFAKLLGVHVSSIYRWEKSIAPRIDPLQLSILEGLDDLPRRVLTDLGPKIQIALLEQNGLRALHVALTTIVAHPPA